MSDKDLDKLFKGKMEELRQEPSPQAWDQISSEIHSRKSFTWWYVAAAVILLLSAVAVFQSKFLDTPGTPEIAMESTAPADEPATVDSAESAGEDTVVEITDETEVNKDQEDAGEVNEPVSSPVNPPEEKQYNQRPQEVAPIESIPEAKTVASAETKPEDEPLPIEPVEDIISESTAVATVAGGSTRSFNIEQFAEAEIPDNPEEVEEERGLKKVWNLLRNVKEPSNGIGDLREMKNGLLAFGKSKKESENQ